jgi:hypothetical protein
MAHSTVLFCALGISVVVAIVRQTHLASVCSNFPTAEILPDEIWGFGLQNKNNMNTCRVFIYRESRQYL